METAKTGDRKPLIGGVALENQETLRSSSSFEAYASASAFSDDGSEGQEQEPTVSINLSRPATLPKSLSGPSPELLDSLVADNKAASQSGILGRLFRTASKRREALDLDSMAEALPTQLQPISKVERQPSGAPSLSPRLWLMPRSFSSKVSQANGVPSTPPESPQQSGAAQWTAETAAPGEVTPPSGAGQPRRWSLWPRNERQRSVSFDAREAASNVQNGEKLKGQPTCLPGMPASQPGLLDDLGDHKRFHKRSKSYSQAALGEVVGVSQDEAKPGVFSFLSCTAPPKVSSDDGLAEAPIKTRAEPNAPLLNLGNLCFHTAVMQCLCNTNGLPQALWQSFPAVPKPPKYAQHEPLSEFAAPCVKGPSPRPEPSQAFTERASTASRASADGSAANSVIVQEDDSISVSSQSSISSVRSNAEAAPASNLHELPVSSDSAVEAEPRPHQGNARCNEMPGSNAEAEKGASEPNAAAGPGEGPHVLSGPEPSKKDPGRPVLTLTADSAQPQAVESAAAGEKAFDTPQASGNSQILPRACSSVQSDSRMAEMSRRAAAAAEGEPRPVVARRLSQAMAYVMSQMLESKVAVNPLPAVYFLAQYSTAVTQLLNGTQQDVHELWITLNEILNDPANAYEEAGGKLSDIFEGTTRTTRSCRRCSDVVTGSAEAFSDLILPLPQGANVAVDSCLNAYCAPSTVTVECAKCKAEDEAPQKGLGKKLKKTMFKGKEESKTCKTGFEKLPAAMAIQLHRAVSDSKALMKLETAIKVNLTLQLWKHVCDNVKPSRTVLKGDAEKNSGKGSAGKPQLRPSDGGEGDCAGEEAAKCRASPAAELREEDCEYRLYACILHKGQSQNRGHYYAMCRAGSSDDDWYLYDDHNKPVPLSERGRMEKYLNLTECEKREVCMLFYEQISREQTPCLRK